MKSAGQGRANFRGADDTYALAIGALTVDPVNLLGKFLVEPTPNLLGQAPATLGRGSVIESLVRLGEFLGFLFEAAGQFVQLFRHWIGDHVRRAHTNGMARLLTEPRMQVLEKLLSAVAGSLEFFQQRVIALGLQKPFPTPMVVKRIEQVRK